MKTIIRAQLKQLGQYRSLRWVLGIGSGYLLLCLLVVVLLNWQVGKLYQQQTGRVLQSDLVTFNPFTFAITARDLEDHNPDGSLLWSAQQVQLNLAPLDSLLERTPILDAVEIEGLRLHPHLLANGSWNFDDILKHQAALPVETAQDDSEDLPALRINNTRIAIAELQFSDSSLADPFSTSFKDILFELQGFSTLDEAGQVYQLSARTAEGGELNWKGTISLKGGQSQGELAAKNLNLLPVWQYLKSSLNFTLQNARLSAAGNYKVQWHKDFSWSVEQGKLALTDGKLRSGKASARNAELSLAALTLEGITAGSQTQQLVVDKAQLNGLHLSSWSQGSDTGLAQAFILKSLAGDQTVTESADTPSWVVRVNNFAINNAALDWRVAELEQRLFKARQLNFAASNFDSSGGTNMDVRLATHIDQDANNPGIQLTVTGGFNPVSLDGDFSADLQALPVSLANPLLTPYMRATIIAGQLQAKAELQVRDALLTQVKTTGSLTDLKLLPASATQEVLAWNDLRWSETLLDLTTQEVTIPLLELSGFDSRFELKSDGTTNLETLFPTSIATPDAAKGSQQAKPEEEEKPWEFNLHKLAVEKSSVRFNDESLTPKFTAAVQNFHGTLTGLSSDTRKPANFKFHGDVDGYAPVNLQGHTQPFLEQPQLDARLDFENMDLGGLSGYSSTYAGWRIERGLLTANLHYRLKDGRVIGDNHIEMDQLQLGEKVQNSQAVDVPLRLALALITDENGLATLDIGVSGNTTDPSFDLGTVIRQAVRNTFVKILKSPFTLLANIAGSKEDLGQLPFNSGSSQLLTTATRKLNSLQQALQKRPELRIELRGHYDQNTDTRGLQAAQIKQKLLERGLSSKDIKAKKEPWQKAIAEEYRALDLPAAKNLTAEQMYEQWLQTISIAPETLTQLAAQRSINAKQFLVQQLKVDSSRVLINSNLDCSEAEMCSRRIVRLDLSDLNQTSVAE
ncbi:MAG TPA: DUF748 domain-containing protein [Cellvibrio sp.]|nr:DUF748 domain-containing protein [Cellvibrio sp.]